MFDANGCLKLRRCWFIQTRKHIEIIKLIWVQMCVFWQKRWFSFNSIASWNWDNGKNIYHLQNIFFRNKLCLVVSSLFPVCTHFNDAVYMTNYRILKKSDEAEVKWSYGWFHWCASGTCSSGYSVFFPNNCVLERFCICTDRRIKRSIRHLIIDHC